jgi:hypothetical protein
MTKATKTKAVKKAVAVVDTNAELDAALALLEGKSAKIRYMDSIGMDRKAIAAKLAIRYQHVRNVLVTQLKKDIVKK